MTAKRQGHKTKFGTGAITLYIIQRLFKNFGQGLHKIDTIDISSKLPFKKVLYF